MNKLENLKKIVKSDRAKSGYLASLVLASLLNLGFTNDKNSDNKIKRINKETTSSSIMDDDIVRPDIMLDMFKFIDELNYEESQLTIEERQNRFLEKYNVQYLNMVMAVTEIIPGVNLDYSGAYEVLARPDFEEMKKEFADITERKIEYICKRYSINIEQLLMICRRMCNESGGLNYMETYHCCTCLYNRIFSYPWILDLNSHGYNGYYLFDQFRYPNQFGYGVPTKAQYDDPSKWIGYYAVLDMLSSEKPTHDYTGFRMASVGTGEQLEPGGNRYQTRVPERLENPYLVNVTPKEPIKLADFYKATLDKLVPLEAKKDEDILILCRK